MAVVEKYKKYAIEKKQVSRDRGITWEDVSPSETRYGEELGIFDTLEECEDTNCDLEKYEISLVDDEMPDNICTHPRGTAIGFTMYDTLLPSGIAKEIHFTDGMYCCVDAWGSSDNKIIDEYYEAEWKEKTATITTGWNPVRQYNTFTLDGRQMESGAFCGHQTCFTITEFMPWIQAGDTIKMAYKVKYVREHCSNDWEIDEEFEPELITIGERWVKIYEDAYKTTWQHQVVDNIIFEGLTYEGLPFQVIWKNEGLPFDYFYETNIPENVDFVDAIINDGVLCNDSVSEILPRVQMRIKVDSNRGDPTGNLMTKYYHYSTDTSGCTYPFYNYDYEGERKYYIDPSSDYGTRIYDDRYTTVNFDKWQQGSLNASYGALFCSIYIRQEQCGRDYKGRVITCPVVYNGGSITNNTRCKELIVFDTDEIYFPYKVRSNYGWQDDYLNACEYGFIKRDGSKIIVGYVYGKYTNTNGVTQNITNNANTSLSLPSDAVDVILADSVTSIPNGCFANNTVLTSITMNNVNVVGDNAFSGCSNLGSITFGSTNIKLYDKSFANSGLRSVDLSNVIRIESENTSTSNAGAAFSGCTQLETLTIGSSLTNIPQYSFLSCANLRSVTIPSNVSTIGNYSFQDCTSLTSVTISEGVTYIGMWAFRNTRFREVTIPSTVTSYGYSGAFRDNPNLEKVTINTTATITADTFTGCNIKCLTMTTLTPPTVKNGRAIWGGVFDFAPDAVILVPCEAVDTYKNDGGNEGWDNVASMIHPIPNETRWVDNGYVCVDGMKYKQQRKEGRNTDCSDDAWFDLAEYRLDGEPYGECLYEELYYIKRDSSHTGQIYDLGVTVKDNTRIQIKVQPTSNGGGIVIGERNAPSDDNDYRVFWASSKIYYDYGDSRLNTSLSLNSPYELEIGNYYVKYIDGSNIISGDTKSDVATEHTRKLQLFGDSDYGLIYYIKIYEGTRQTHNFIPVRREDGLVTLYETINRYFCDVDGVFAASDE